MSTFHEIHQFQPAIGVIMKKLLLIMLTVFSTTLAFAECSKTELLQFIELGFSKEEIKQICKDDSISFDEEQSVDSEQKSDE